MNCENCDLPLATDEDFQKIPPGEGEHLCWSRYGTKCEPEDWRARALTAERERDEAQAEVERLRKLVGPDLDTRWQGLVRDHEHERRRRQKAEADVELWKQEAEQKQADFAMWFRLANDERKETNWLRAALEDFAEYDCSYGDNCPSNAGTRHGTCVGCKARRALENK